MRKCEMCAFGATVKCDYCSALVCPEHYENVTVDKGRKEGCIVLQACMACTPEAMRVRSERQQQAETARREEDRNNRLALLDQAIADPTTALGQRAQAHVDATFIKYGDYITLLIVLLIGIGLLLLMFWVMMCPALALDGSNELFEIFHCGKQPVDLLRRFLDGRLY